MNANPFLLTKWYLDCVAENGDTVIVYAAHLRWNTLSFQYASIITVLDGKVGTASSLHGIPLPELHSDVLTLHQPGLDTEGTWVSLRPAIRRTVFRDENGEVDWHCMQPMAEVDLRLRQKIRLRGLGYAECLTVSIVPWQLPLTGLNWGRFLSREHAVVWIDWMGGQGLRSVIHNGEEFQQASMTESQVSFDAGHMRLELDRGLVVRQGQLGDTVFPGIAKLARLVPRSMLSVSECKWRSRGVLQTPEGTSNGWAIHEIVKWND